MSRDEFKKALEAAWPVSGAKKEELTEGALMDLARLISEMPKVGPFPCPNCNGPMGPDPRNAWVCPEEKCMVSLSDGRRAVMLWSLPSYMATYTIDGGGE